MRPGVGATEAEIAERCGRIMDAIPSVIDDRGRVDVVKLGRVVGLGPSTIEKYRDQLREMGWKGLFTGHPRHLRRKGQAVGSWRVGTGNPRSHHGLDRPDPGRMLQERLKAYAGMSSGSGQIDDPRDLRAPRSWHPPMVAPGPVEETSTDVTRRLLREYRRIRAGKPAAEPRPREVGRPHNGDVPRKPPKRQDAIMFGKQVGRHHHAS